MLELKACPFCGEIEDRKPFVDNELSPHHFAVVCENCGVYVDHIGAWNTRPIEDTLTARVKELEQTDPCLHITISGLRDVTEKQALTIKELEGRMERALTVLGPNVPNWAITDQGVLWEWQEALNILNEGDE